MIDALLEKNLLPDWLLRLGIRRRLARRLRKENVRYNPATYAANLTIRPLAEHPHAANAQPQEVPAVFYQCCLGRRLKYSGCLYRTGAETLDQAEEAMLALYAERAQLADGQDILDLGCGWGSFSLWMAEKFPAARITGVSNSRSQKTHIDSEARRRGLTNLHIVTAGINDLTFAAAQFDRVVSVEMFEHVKNYYALLGHIDRWLRPAGLLFVHIFTHKNLSYHFTPYDETDWLGRHFFNGTQMPAADLLPRFQDHLKLANHWTLDGTHYQRTAEHWLENMDRHREEILPLFAHTYGPQHAKKWWAYWRVFFISCAERWGYRHGTEWLVSHYLFRKP